MAGRLDEGLRGGIKGGGGIKAWSQDLAWHLEVGGRARAGWLEVTRRSGNGRPAGEEGEADSPSPLDRETREKRPAQKT
jgi:hypothetical protein